jgi:hypothetical protein
MKYTYIVKLDKMEETYLLGTQTNFFENDEERNKFNAELIIYADSEEESYKMRTGMTDVRMWELISAEETD